MHKIKECIQYVKVRVNLNFILSLLINSKSKSVLVNKNYNNFCLLHTLNLIQKFRVDLSFQLPFREQTMNKACYDQDSNKKIVLLVQNNFVLFDTKNK